MSKSSFFGTKTTFTSVDNNFFWCNDLHEMMRIFFDGFAISTWLHVLVQLVALCRLKTYSSWNDGDFPLSLCNLNLTTWSRTIISNIKALNLFVMKSAKKFCKLFFYCTKLLFHCKKICKILYFVSRTS